VSVENLLVRANLLCPILENEISRKLLIEATGKTVLILERPYDTDEFQYTIKDILLSDFQVIEHGRREYPRCDDGWG
jgi:hypothetical protein